MLDRLACVRISHRTLRFSFARKRLLFPPAIDDLGKSVWGGSKRIKSRVKKHQGCTRALVYSSELPSPSSSMPPVSTLFWRP